MIHAKYGIPPIAEMTQTHSIGNFAANPSSAAERLLTLAQAHEAKELEGPFGKYVWGASAGTNRINRRLARVSAILRALGVNVPSAVDANIS